LVTTSQLSDLEEILDSLWKNLINYLPEKIFSLLTPNNLVVEK